MCDTLVGLAGSTARGAALFAKNSDRERNESQALEMTPRRSFGGDLQLTYIAIPDAAATHACLLSRPFWMWGAEMGANEHGVVIGNEALHAKTPAQRKRALTGMDLVRLGLERAASAAEAVEVMTGLLERHGQGGDCGHLGRFYYNNGSSSPIRARPSCWRPPAGGGPWSGSSGIARSPTPIRSGAATTR